MRHRYSIGIIALAIILPTVLSEGQAVSLQEQLIAQYKLAKMGRIPEGSGSSILGRC